MTDPNRATGGDPQTTLPKAIPDPETADAYGLIVLFSPDREVVGRVQRLPRERLELGRTVGADGLSFDDPLASRAHASVAWDAGRERYLIADAASRNGTFLNGVEIDVEVLSPGDIVRLGDTVLRFAHLDLEMVGWSAPADSPLRGRSLGLRNVLAEVRRVAKTDLSVLVLGETGTGKELVAREIHRRSGRSGPFQALNCAALPGELLERELFGHKRGAFTGADRDQPGLIQSANGGALFMDEIGELAHGLQAKLLRVLDEKRVRPVGATHAEPIDVRFVFATNCDLGAAVAQGTFRADLYARLNQWEIRVPPLRERPEDLLPVTEELIRAHGAGHAYTVSGDFFEALALHDWPYNVRELVSLVRKALVLLPEGGTFGLEHVPYALRPGGVAPNGATVADAPDTLPPAGETPTAQELVRLMKHYHGNVADVARHAGRERVQVYRWLRRYGLRPDAFRGRP